MKTTIYAILMMAVVLVAAAGCNKGDDKKDIVGIWQVKSAQMGGRETGDGMGWFHFKEGGTVDTRPRPGGYESGKYTIDPDNHKLTMIGDNGGQLTYDYVLGGDSLELSAIVPANNHKFVIKAYRVKDYPITKENDVIEPEMPEDGTAVPLDTLHKDSM